MTSYYEKFLQGLNKVLLENPISDEASSDRRNKAVSEFFTNAIGDLDAEEREQWLIDCLALQADMFIEAVQRLKQLGN